MTLPPATDLSFTNERGLRIFGQGWLPSAVLRGVIVLVHGYAEHHGRYQPFIGRLLAAGYAVYALDHEGHGRSEGLRGYVSSFDHLIADLHRFRLAAVTRHAGVPVFMFGHSMGGLITLVYGTRHAEGLAGLIVSGAAVITDASASALVLRIGLILNRLAPRLPLVQLAPPDQLTHDQALVAAFNADPLVYHAPMRVGTGIQMREGAAWLRAHFDRLTLPTLYLHGTADTVVTVEGSKLAYAQAASTDKTLKLYDGLYHEILNEPERETVIADVLGWLATRTA